MEKPDQRDYDFSSQEGYDQYDAAVAEYERKKKGPMIGTEFVDTVEDVVKSGVEQISKVPILRTGLQYLGGAVKTVDQVMSQDQGPGGMIYRTYKNVKSASEEGFGDLAENVGVDRRIGEFGGGEIIDAFATAGTGVAAKRAANVIDKLPPGGMSQQLATAGISPMGLAPSGGSFTLKPQVMKAVTATDEPTLSAVRGGVRTGDTLVTGNQGKRLIRRDIAINDLKNNINEINSQLDALLELKGDPKNLNLFVNDTPDVKMLMNKYNGNVDRVANRLRERRIGAQESLSRQQSNVQPFEDTDPNYFRSKVGMDAKKAEEVSRKIQGYLEQHHLFPKGMSAAFFNRMDELIETGKATKDDLILMSEYAVIQGKKTGDVRSNLINMQKDPHSELHTILRAQGAELGKSDFTKMLKKVDNVDDLLVRWRDLLAGDAAYNIETAKIWEPLDELLKELR
jgi:hypothetical protein